jgi:ABC-type nitrate/sulfonate/bicarbonate transport system permease component
MLSNEIYASKEGLGYTIAVASHTFQTAKAFAAILILFALLIALSATVRWITKRVVLPSAKAATPANLEQNPAVG